MNQNIEVITPNLWAVDFHHLQYIKELHKDNESGSLDRLGSISEDGILVLNKSHELFSTMKQVMPRIMSSNNAQLVNRIRDMSYKDRDGYDRLLKCCLNAELKRRMVDKEHRKQLKGKSILGEILDFIGLIPKRGG